MHPCEPSLNQMISGLVNSEEEYSKVGLGFMIVRIRFGLGRRVTRRQGKNVHAARVTASMLGLVAICLGIFGFWRLGEDLGFLGEFDFPRDFFRTGRCG